MIIRLLYDSVIVSTDTWLVLRTSRSNLDLTDKNLRYTYLQILKCFWNYTLSLYANLVKKVHHIDILQLFLLALDRQVWLQLGHTLTLKNVLSVLNPCFFYQWVYQHSLCSFVVYGRFCFLVVWIKNTCIYEHPELQNQKYNNSIKVIKNCLPDNEICIKR